MIFEKYHSLENDFIIIDHNIEPKVVQRLCHRHSGIGADGVLVVNTKKQNPDVSIFNSNGNKAETCLNGLRCVAHYLYTKHNFTKNFILTMGGKTHPIEICESSRNLLIHTHINYATYQEKVSLNSCGKTFDCHIVNVGNPHCVVFQQLSLEEIKTIGPYIEQHPYFSNKTNVVNLDKSCCSSRRDNRKSAWSGVASSAAAVGVGARRSAAKSAMVKSVS